MQSHIHSIQYVGIDNRIYIIEEFKESRYHFFQSLPA